jgi:hypothetical protein
METPPYSILEIDAARLFAVFCFNYLLHFLVWRIRTCWIEMDLFFLYSSVPYTIWDNGKSNMDKKTKISEYCEKCATEICPDDSYEHLGKTLCEDCYLDMVAAPKTCDPWAVYSAKKTASQGVCLTAEQQRIFDLIKTKGPLTLGQICDNLSISEEEFKNNFATLRHMELARGCQMEGKICYVLFGDQLSVRMT